MLQRIVYISKLYNKRTGFISNKIVNLNNYTSNSYKLNLKATSTDLTEYVARLRTEYEDLSRKGKLTRRLVELQPIIDILERRDGLIDNIMNLKELLEDPDNDIKRLAEEERKSFEANLKLLDDQLEEVLLPSDDFDSSKSILLEVNAGVGGQEAMLFAKELFEMYCNFCKYKGWDLEQADYQVAESGGVRHASALISGDSVFRYFKYEAGVHRVQRIPATEKYGRIHTSTVSVRALPQPEDIDIKINPQDLKIETKRASGAGGQHVNTTDSAIRITHLPTNTMVECQVDRSQHKNRQIAMQKLRTLLYERQLESQMAEIKATRKSQVKSNNRNEKIRTYNFSQDRITDHRLQNCNFHNLKVFLQGEEDLEELIHKLNYKDRIEMLINDVNSVRNK